MCEGNAGMHLRKAIIGMCVDSRDTECLNECMYGDGLLYATIRSVKAKSGVWGCWRSVCAPFTSQGWTCLQTFLHADKWENHSTFQQLEVTRSRAGNTSP